MCIIVLLYIMHVNVHVFRLDRNQKYPMAVGARSVSGLSNDVHSEFLIKHIQPEFLLVFRATPNQPLYLFATPPLSLLSL